MGIVINEKEARESKCMCYKLDGEDLCWSRGVIGALSDKQETLYCNPKEYKNSSPRIKERYKKFIKVVEKCKGLHLPEFLKCMSKEAEKERLEI